MRQIEPPSRLTEILKRSCDHVLTRADDGRYFLEVTCGTIGLYTATLQLTADQVAAMTADPTFIERLSRTVFSYPEEFGAVCLSPDSLSGVERITIPADDSPITQRADRTLLPKPS